MPNYKAVSILTDTFPDLLTDEQLAICEATPAAAIERFTSECKKLREELADLIADLRITKDELQRVRNSGPTDL